MAQKESDAPVYKRIYRSKTDRILGGVAGGLGEYLDLDPTIFRLIFVILTVFGGSGIIIYLILWLIMPEKDNGKKFEDTIKDNADDIKEKAQNFAQEIRLNRKSDTKEERRFWWGLIILVVGLLFLFSTLGLLNLDEVFRFWPLILILIGLSIILRR